MTKNSLPRLTYSSVLIFSLFFGQQLIGVINHRNTSTIEAHTVVDPSPTLRSAPTKTHYQELESSSSTELPKLVLGALNKKLLDQPLNISLLPSAVGTVTLVGPELNIEPIDANGSVIIPKIGVNSPIEFDIPVSNKESYQNALDKGIAHAQGTGKPDILLSNTYLFSHSTADERNIARYAAVFTKLNELTSGDMIIVYYQGKRYDYEMVSTEIVPSFDTTVLTRQHNYSALTLQTCDPPGQALNRLIVTARLIDIYDQ